MLVLLSYDSKIIVFILLRYQLINEKLHNLKYPLIKRITNEAELVIAAINALNRVVNSYFTTSHTVFKSMCFLRVFFTCVFYVCFLCVFFMCVFYMCFLCVFFTCGFYVQSVFFQFAKKRYWMVITHSSSVF